VVRVFRRYAHRLGPHHLDIAQWAWATIVPEPVEVEGRGEFPNFPKEVDPSRSSPGARSCPMLSTRRTTFEATLSFEKGFSIVACHGKSNGILLEAKTAYLCESGANSRQNRSRISARPDRARFADPGLRLYKGRSIDPEAVVSKDPGQRLSPGQCRHMADFFTGVRERQQPVSDVFSHHRARQLLPPVQHRHVLRRKLRWDPQKETSSTTSSQCAGQPPAARAVHDLRCDPNKE